MNDTERQQYYPYFDYLRIALACIVMFGHAGAEIWNPSGKLAVDVFFALSGWLIGGALLNTAKAELPKFYFNRAIRIWIPYYIALVLLLAPSIVMDPIDYKWFEFVIYKATQVYNIFGTSQLANFNQQMPLNGIGNHFWSVNAEEQFYLLAPILLVLFPKVGRMLGVWIFVIGVVWFFWIYPPISLGVFAALLKYNYPNFHKRAVTRILLSIALVFAIIGIAPSESFRDLEYKIFSPIIAICVVLMLAIEGKKTKQGSFLGGISYPLYLNHWLGIVVANRLLGYLQVDNLFVKYFVLSLLNLGLAAVLYFKIEKVALGLRSYWYNRKRGLACIFLAYSMMLFGLIFGILQRHFHF